MIVSSIKSWGWGRLIGSGLILLAVSLPPTSAAATGWRAGLILATGLVVYLAERWRQAKSGLLVLFGLGLVLYAGFHIRVAAWLLLISWFGGWLVVSRRLRSGLLLAPVAGLGPVVYNAVELNFAEEEFFIGVTAFYLCLFWLSLAIAYRLTVGSAPITRRSTEVLLWGGLIGAGVLLSPWLLQRYQRSFFPLTAPTYPGLSEETPFLCEKLPDAPSSTIPGGQVEDHFIRLLANSSPTHTLVLGSLALHTGQSDYAQAFRANLLQEAAEARYTSPAHSIKWGQFMAARRLDQYARLRRADPDLFSETDQAILAHWFGRINHRAMTAEWVDWLYAAAFGSRPVGPYENQEIGAGLLALLETTDLAAPALSEANRAYLATTPLGWQALFRNTDDAYTYQGVWLSNAWWLAAYRQPAATIDRNRRLAYLWLLALALPDGETLAYNFAGSLPLIEHYLAGAAELEDPRLVWLAEQALSRREAHGGDAPSLFTPPPLDLVDGAAPDIGSCLIFGNSGVPTEKGPLAPDKIVLRDGWQPDAAYLLWNLRFSGWHRYKATNTLTLLYRVGPLVTESWRGEQFQWLPKGRSAFRDKRVPRENLNGLLIPKAGLARSLWLLSGVGRGWAQNPPAYAQVEQFFSGSRLDGAKAVLTDWNGWRHERTVYLIHAGLVVVVDRARANRAAGPAAIMWHVSGSGRRTANGLYLDEAAQARLVWPEEADRFITIQPETATDLWLRNPDWSVLYTAPRPHQLDLATAFLTGPYAAGEIALSPVAEKQGLAAMWQNDSERLWLLHNHEPGRMLTYEGLGTDGLALLVIEDKSSHQLEACYVGGQTLQIALPSGSRIISLVGKPAHACLKL